VSFNQLPTGSPAYVNALSRAENLLGYNLPMTRRPPTLWALEGPGENWDEVTEAFHVRPLQAILVLGRTDQIEVAIAVETAFRGRGVGTRLLRWVLTNQYDSFASRVHPDRREGLAFAAKHGQFDRLTNGLFHFTVDRETSRLPHIGCPCSDCYNELSFAA